MTLLSRACPGARRGLSGAALLLAVAVIGAGGSPAALAQVRPAAVTAETPAPTVTPAPEIAYKTPANPVVDDEGFATFTFTSATAQKVTLNGAWGPSNEIMMLTMRQVGNGVFRSMIGPLKPGTYGYVIAADGTDVQDPLNPNKVNNLPIMSVFSVPGVGAADAQTRDVPHGALSILTYYSKVTKSLRKASVWAPPGYSDTSGLPTFYLQHGGGGDYLEWIRMARANDLLDNLYADKKIKPMLVVFPDGSQLPGGFGMPQEDSYPTELTENVVPAVEQAYGVSTKAADRALAGLSMGGLQTFNTLLVKPGFFPALGDFSSGFFGDLVNRVRTEGQALLTNPAINEKTTLLRIYCGNKTDLAYENNIATRKLFDDFGIKYEFGGIYAPAGHVWETWQVNVTDFAPRLFR